MKKILLVIAAAFTLAAARAQVKSPKEFLGYEIGQQFTPHYKIVNYFNSLAQSAPAQMKLEQYGTTNEGRPLLLAFISSPENMARLEEIRTNNLRLAGLASGSGSSNGPAIVWLSYNVHGNEASSSEATMLTTHFLLTDSKAKEWLKTAVVVVDPCINPDGRDRYVNWYNSVVGSQMNPDPSSREHMEPWPGGRSNHYNFDLNRDWAWQTQVETQQRIAKYNQWMPQIHVDFHEQGYNEPYYFAPAAEPFHEVITPWQREFQTRIGRNHAKYFDKEGWLYFTKERFDLFYPSYGDTWPTYNGGIGMTYEQGGHSRGGLGIINEDGDTLTLRDRALHHHTTGMSTVEIASQNAASLLQNFQKFFADASKNGVGEYKSFVVKGAGNEAKIKPLIDLLNRNGIEFGYASPGQAKGLNYNSGKEESFSLEKGDLVVSTVQPRGNMAKVLFEPSSKLNDSATYDITAWSVPYAFGLNAYAVKEKITTTQILAASPAKAITTPSYGYLKSWGSMADATFLAACLAKGIKARVSEKPFEVNGKQYAAGTLIFIKTSNHSIADFDRQLQELATRHQVELDPVGTGFMDKGADFGSPDVNIIIAPKVAIITGEGTSSLGAGELWHYFDKELQYPSSLINLREAGNINWRKYDVVIVPDGYDYRNLMAKDGDLRNWVEQGGKLVLLENAVAQLASADWGLNAKKAEEEKTNPEDYKLLKKYADRERDNLVSNNPGSIYRVELDNSHPLAFGYPTTYFTLKSDSRVYEFMPNGWNVGVIKKGGLVAGFSGVEVKQKLNDGVLFGELPVGRGSVVFLADDVIFRSFWENGKLLMANAVFMAGLGRGFRI